MNISNRPLKLGILLPTRHLLMSRDAPSDIEPVLSLAEAAEQAGLDSVWVGDSLTAKPRLEPLTTLSAVAQRTHRVRLGTAVLLAALRQPVGLAHALGTLDLISGGRLVVGAGVGGAFNDAQRQEWRNAGVDPSRRAARFEETIEVARKLTRGESVSHHGEHFDLNGVSVQPRSVRPEGIPYLIACHWQAEQEVQFQRAARIGDGVISITDRPEEYEMVLAKVEMYAEKQGRDFSRMEKAFYMTVNLESEEAAASREADEFLHLYYGMNFWGDRWGPYGHPERTVERMLRYAERGAETIVVRFASLNQERQLEIFLRDVAQAFS